MIVYSCDKLGLSFGDEIILENINLSINERDRIGIVGDNGAGKTTFIKILLQHRPGKSQRDFGAYPLTILSYAGT